MLNQGIQITDKPDGEDVQRVLSGLREYNYSHVKSDIRDIGIFVRDEVVPWIWPGQSDGDRSTM